MLAGQAWEKHDDTHYDPGCKYPVVSVAEPCNTHPRLSAPQKRWCKLILTCSAGHGLHVKMISRPEQTYTDLTLVVGNTTLLLRYYYQGLESGFYSHGGKAEEYVVLGLLYCETGQKPRLCVRVLRHAHRLAGWSWRRSLCSTCWC